MYTILNCCNFLKNNINNLQFNKKDKYFIKEKKKHNYFMG